jgi:hypothetical protein
MKITQVFQKLIALVAVVALSFGFAASSASAAQVFNAPLGANFVVSYFVGTEVGITARNQINRNTVLWCNNKYGEGAGPEWRSKCLNQQTLPASEKYQIEGFSKATVPGSTCWNSVADTRLQVPSPFPGNNRYIVTMVSPGGNAVAQVTVDGPNVQAQGEPGPSNPDVDVCNR